MDPRQTLNKLQIKPSENFRQTHDKALRNLKPTRKPHVKKSQSQIAPPPPKKKIKNRTSLNKSQPIHNQF